MVIRGTVRFSPVPASRGDRAKSGGQALTARGTLRIVDREEVTMASRRAEPATNERIVRLLEQVQVQLVDSKKREEQIARDLARLLNRR